MAHGYVSIDMYSKDFNIADYAATISGDYKTIKHLINGNNTNNMLENLRPNTVLLNLKEHTEETEK